MVLRRVRVRVSVSFLISAIMKLPKYGKTCVVLEGILCYKFVTSWEGEGFSAILLHNMKRHDE